MLEMDVEGPGASSLFRLKTNCFVRRQTWAAVKSITLKVIIATRRICSSSTLLELVRRLLSKLRWPAVKSPRDLNFCFSEGIWSLNWRNVKKSDYAAGIYLLQICYVFTSLSQLNISGRGRPGCESHRPQHLGQPLWIHYCPWSQHTIATRQQKVSQNI